MAVSSSQILALIRRHSQPGPRYTSYPTAPQWVNQGPEVYREHLRRQRARPRDLALYFHIPFCESLCYYCGCNIKITKDHSRSQSYVESLLQEMKTSRDLLDGRWPVAQVSWGGGTPTFLTVEEMVRLHRGTQEYFEILPDAEVSIEVDPRVTTREQLKQLRELGFNRISLGVQDFHPATQEAINRKQSVAMTESMLAYCRELGFSGINFDLIYGLPHQTLQTFQHTLSEVVRILPDRIAFYNYAHLPSLIPHQKILDPMPMPGPEERVEIFNLALERLGAAGYRTIGMDHFALETDELFRALQNRSLYRNFMGYTVKKGTDMLGFGTSAIGEIDNAFFQNQKDVRTYQETVGRGEAAAFRGLLLSPDDVVRKAIIQALMCQFTLSYADFDRRFGFSFTQVFQNELSALTPFVDEGSLRLTPEGIEVTEQGRLFVRNIAMNFDAYLKRPGNFTGYSKTV